MVAGLGIPPSKFEGFDSAIYFGPGGCTVFKIAVGAALGFLIGAGCRWFDVPAPSPPTLLGACLVVAMTLGYVTADRVMATRASNAQPPTPNSQGER
jgi:XapX domain-containing protein